jgi:hypothetical protein
MVITVIKRRDKYRFILAAILSFCIRKKTPEKCYAVLKTSSRPLHYYDANDLRISPTSEVSTATVVVLFILRD